MCILEGQLPLSDSRKRESSRKWGRENMMRRRKMSKILREMSERLPKIPRSVQSSEAAHVALMFAHIAWNEALGLGGPRETYRAAWKMIEAENPEMWSEFKSKDVESMIDKLVDFKKKHYPNDHRRILVCSMPSGNVRVEWLPPVAPGVDSRWEMELYGLVRTGERDKAIQFLRETCQVSHHDAVQRVTSIAADIGIT